MCSSPSSNAALKMVKHVGEAIPNPGEFKYTLINIGSCFHLMLPTMTIQPQQKLAASDTQALCKYLLSKNVDILSDWRVHKLPRL